MKVLHFVDCNTLSWLEPWLAHMDALSHLGVEQELLCRPGGDIARRARERGMTVYEWRPLIAALPALSPGYIEIVRASSPDIVHTRLSSAAGIAGHWAARVGIPTIATFDKPAKAKYYTKMTRCISCAKWLKDYMVEHEGLAADKIDVIHNSVDTMRYARSEDARAKMLAKLGIADDETVFSGMGIYTKSKAFEVLMRAFAQVCETHADRRLRLALIGGETDAHGMRDSYVSLASELNIAGNLIMPEAFVDDVHPWLCASDIFVAPSRSEGFSIALLEALASDLPVVVSDIDPFTEIINDGKNGLVAKVDDVASFADAMGQLLTMDTGSIGAMLDSSREIMERNFTLKAGAKKTYEVYSKILEGYK